MRRASLGSLSLFLVVTMASACRSTDENDDVTPTGDGGVRGDGSSNTGSAVTIYDIQMGKVAKGTAVKLVDV
ncbi:MAG: hypothetical protein HY698_02730, partial [Deltaproteobacteria bacterium]|nr:hypothetical protein [Deltaproteobacteria bacterium]